MIRSVLITRTDLGLSPLQLWQPGKFLLPDNTFGGGPTTQRRVTSESPMVKGRYASGIVEGQRTGGIAVHVIAGTSEGVQPLVEEVVAALTQFRFTLAWQWNGLSGSWQCEAADWAPGSSSGVLDLWLKWHNQQLFFVVPHRRLTGV